MEETKVLPKLTRKQKAFADELIANPKQSATAAIKKTYNIGVRGGAESTARAVAAETLAKPSVMQYLKDKAKEAELAIFEVMEVNRPLAAKPANGALVLGAANSILDRVHGKATQRVETTSLAVNLSIDLSGDTLPSDIIDGDAAE